MPHPDRDHHPRPRMIRSGWHDLSGPWGFAHDDGDTGLRDGWWRDAAPFRRTITVPFPPESPASGIGEDGRHPVVWYRREAELAPPGAGRRLLLHFGAVDYRADVWVNGVHLAAHEGGHTPFTVDATDALAPSGPQVVTVRAEDSPDDLEQPRGKQDWETEPHEIWYRRTTGIWQPVWAEVVPDVHVERLRFTPLLDELALEVEVGLRGAGPVRVTVRAGGEDDLIAEDTFQVTAGDTLRRRLPIDHLPQLARYLWSPERPTLHDVTVTVHGDGDRPDDVVTSYVGLRQVGTDHRRFLLNRRPYYLRMALAQGYWPETHLAAPSGDALRAEVAWAKSLGFNGLRLHQKVEDPRLLYWCDRLGLCVWGEMASAYRFTSRALARTTREWLEAVERDASHPCVVAWVPFNESWGVPAMDAREDQRDAVRALYHLLRALDPTRPVLGNDGWEYVGGDILGIHDYGNDPAKLVRRYRDRAALEHTVHDVRPGPRQISLTGETPEKPAMLTEFGGILYTTEPSTAWNGYGAADDADAFVERYRELLRAVHASDTLAGFCYTQLTDTVQERNGLLTEDRTPKADPEVLAAITRGQDLHRDV